MTRAERASATASRSAWEVAEVGREAGWVHVCWERGAAGALGGEEGGGVSSDHGLEALAPQGGCSVVGAAKGGRGFDAAGGRTSGVAEARGEGEGAAELGDAELLAWVCGACMVPA